MSVRDPQAVRQHIDALQDQVTELKESVEMHARREIHETFVAVRPEGRGGQSVGSTSDYQVIADISDADAPPGGVDHCVMLAPAADAAGKRDGAVAGMYLDVVVKREHTVAVESTLH